MESFRKLGLSESLVKALHEAHFTEPTEIQEKTIPLALAGKDVIGGSATGSGKTLAFGASIIENIKHGAGVQALILTPTRELAEQVSNSLHKFSKHFKVLLSAVYGGVGIGPQMRELERADIVVGTPGRILDHLERRTLNLSKVKTLVLDEADRMLDMGFIEDVELIIKQCPKERQTFLFSATISPDIHHIAKRHMNHPVEVLVESYVDASKLEQVYYDVPRNMKFSLLVHFLKNEHSGLVMVFCNTRMNSDFVANNLQRHKIDAIAIHGGLTQNKRNRIMEHFHAGKVYVLVCTDVAARGLDIKNVSHVYNYDLPGNSKDYVHRIGRTARAGKEGKAISLVADRDYENFRSVLRDESLKIKSESLPENLETIHVRFEGRGDGDEGFSRGRRGGGRSFGGRGGSRDRGSGGSRGGSRGGRSFGGRSGGRSFGGRPGGGRSRSFGGRRR